MTPGASEETADGMSEDKIAQIIGRCAHERYRFSPGQADVHSEKERENAPARHADMVR